MTAHPVLRCLPCVALLSAVLPGRSQAAGAARLWSKKFHKEFADNRERVQCPLTQVLLPGKPQRRWRALLPPHSPHVQCLGRSNDTVHLEAVHLLAVPLHWPKPPAQPGQDEGSGLTTGLHSAFCPFSSCKFTHIMSLFHMKPSSNPHFKSGGKPLAFHREQGPSVASSFLLPSRPLLFLHGSFSFHLRAFAHAGLSKADGSSSTVRIQITSHFVTETSFDFLYKTGLPPPAQGTVWWYSLCGFAPEH